MLKKLTLSVETEEFTKAIENLEEAILRLQNTPLIIKSNGIVICEHFVTVEKVIID